MAEEKKPAKPKPASGGGGGMSDREATEQIIYLLAGLILLGALAAAFLNYIESLRLGTYGGILGTIVEYFRLQIWPVWKFLATIISVLAVGGIVYNVRQLGIINREERKIFGPVVATSGPDSTEIIVEDKNEKWERVLKLANSDSSSDWRLAIIEADVMLEELLRASGYVGESVGDMLKGVDKSDFTTLDDAWEAHKVRNDITHTGTDFQLNERETKRVIALFEKVFKEFEII